MKKQDILKMETVAVFGLCNVGGIEIKSVDDEKTVYVVGDAVHCVKTYTHVRRPYFLHGGRRIHLDECMRVNF